jgi:eukaryotic-like serine/threonine-protein kinase
MFCSYCGAGLPDGVAVCPTCHRHVATLPPDAVTSFGPAGDASTSLGESDDVTRLGRPGDGVTSQRPPNAAFTRAKRAADAATAVSTPPPVSSTQVTTGASFGPTTGGTFLSNTGPLAPGTAFGTRYHLIRLLGIGGMGAVYQAWDDELAVAVALKVIRPEVTAEPAAARDLERRFKRELLLARQVTHKNVVRIHDLGEINGIKYITMPYIQGHDLASVLRKEGKVPVQRAVTIARQVVSGLLAAHEVGVVHRDLKPANIMIDEDDQAVIMDFGIARSVSGGGATVVGAVVGTLEYMAPEQAMAQPCDHRADIYAFGLILYDMVLGPRQASRAESAVAELMTRVQNPLPPARTIDPAIPDALERIMDRCTQPDPAARYQTTAELARDLEVLDPVGREGRAGSLAAPLVTRTQPAVKAPARRKLSAKRIAVIGALVAVLGAGMVFRHRLFSVGEEPATATSSAVALAVVPFQNATGDPKLDSLGVSLADLITANLGQSARLRSVPSAHLAQLLRDLGLGQNTELDQTAARRFREFSSADTVVSGRFAKVGGQIQITAAMFGASGAPIPLNAVAATENDLFKVAQQLASGIHSNLALESSAIEELQATASKPSTQSVQALTNYSEGQALARDGNNVDAVQRFEASVKADPGFALAYSKLGQSLAALGKWSDATKASQRAIDLSSKLPQDEREMIAAAHALATRDNDKAIESYERLVKARPNDLQLRFELASLYDANSAFDKARDEYVKVLQADPKFADALFAAGRNAIRRRDYKGSLDWLTTAESQAVRLDNKPLKARVLHAEGTAYKNLGSLGDAMRKFKEALEIRQEIGDKRGAALVLNDIAAIHDVQGRSDEAVAAYQEALKSARDGDDKRTVGIVLINLGAYYLDRGRHDEALASLKSALPIERELGDDERQAVCLSNIGTTYYAKGEYEEARTYLERALEIREKSKIAAAISLTLSNLGGVSTILGDYDRAQKQYVRAVELSRGVDDGRGEAIASLGLGVLYAFQGRYGAALEADDQALKKWRELKERSSEVVQTLSEYGLALSMVGRFDDAKKHLDEAMQVAKGLKSQSLTAQTLNYQGDSAYYRGDVKTARAFFEQAVQTAKRASSRSDELRASVNLAKVAAEDPRPQGAITQLRTLMGQADASGLKYQSAECSLYLGAALIGVKDFRQARTELESAVTKSDSLGARALLARSHYLLGETLRLAGDSAAAAGHYTKARQTLDEIKAEARTDALLARYDLKPILQSAAR